MQTNLQFSEKSLTESSSGTTHPETGTTQPQQISANNAEKNMDASDTFHPEMGTEESQRPYHGMDWGRGDKCCVDGVSYSDGMLVWISRNQGSILCVEENFYSFDTEEHNAIIDHAKNCSVDLKCIHTNAVKNFKKDKGMKLEDKSDTEDSALIRLLYSERPNAFVEPRKHKIEDEPSTPAEIFNMQLVKARREKWQPSNCFVKLWMPYLNLLTHLTKEERRIFGDSLSFQYSMVALAVYCKNRKEFDSWFCARRYRGIPSSNFYRNQLKTLWDKDSIPLEKHYQTRKEIMRLARRTLRKFYKLVKQHQGPNGLFIP
jgi:hypothetical protein